jgi:RNA polymerase sigma-B factor
MSAGAAGNDPGRELERLAAYTKSRDQRERDALLAEYDWVAVAAARRFRDRGEPADDLLQVARVGLIKALERFDPDAGAGFPAYGMATALGELRRHFRDATWRVYAPRAAKDLQSRIARETEQATHELGRAPRVDELAERLGVSVDGVLAALDAAAANRAASLDAPSSADGRLASDRVASSDAPFEDQVAVRQLLDRLPPRERRIVELRFDEGLTQDEIARIIGISQMHVSRLLRGALDTLRRAADAAAEPERPDPAP